jgi:hypothetical protein
VHKSLEKRWKKADQPVFLLAVIMNPYIRRDCFNRTSFIFDFPQLYEVFQTTYKRLYNIKDDANMPVGLRSAFRAYVHREGRWSDLRMSLDELRSEAESQVRPLVILMQYRT